MAERIPTYISLSTVVLLVFSVAYDIGFYGHFGVSLRQVPTSMSDHMRTALLWIPYMGIVGFVVLVNELFTRRMERGMTEEEIIATSPNPSWTKKRRDVPYYLIILLAILAVPLAFWKVIPFSAIILSLIVAWTLFAKFLFNVDRIRRKTPSWFMLCVFLLPIALPFIAWKGYDDAEMSKTDDDFEFVLDNGSVTGKLVRSVGSYHLVWNHASEEIEFIQSGRIASFHRVPQPDQQEEAAAKEELAPSEQPE